METVFCLVIALAGAGVAGAYINLEWKGKRDTFLERNVAPTAVMIALGHGFREPDDPRAKPILEFCEGKLTRVEPSMIPADIKSRNSRFYAREHVYLTYLAGWTWRLFGIRWESLVVLYGGAFGATMVFAYLLLRLAAGRFLSLLAVAGLFTSPCFFLILPNLRDFIKAPFIFALLWFLGLLVRHAWKRWQACLLALGAGMTMGLGMGFRQDMLIFWPLSAAVLMLFVPGTFRESWRNRILLPIVTTFCFLLAASPVLLREHSEQSLVFHRLLGGQSDKLDMDLGLSGAPYTVLPLFNDEYIWTMVSGQSCIHYSDIPSTPFFSKAYDNAGRRFYFQLLATFPADALLRIQGAIRRVVSYGLLDTRSGVFDFATFANDTIFSLMNLREKLFGSLIAHQAVFLLLPVLLVVLSALSLRYAFAAGGIIAYCAGYTSLQFQIRHSFHLEMISWWVLAVSVQLLGTALWRGVLQFRTAGHCARRETFSHAFYHIALFSCVLWGLWGAVPYVADVVQSVQVKRVYAGYASAPLQPLEMVPSMESGMMQCELKELLSWDAATERERGYGLKTEMVVVEVERANREFTLQFNYVADTKRKDFSQSVTIPEKSDQAPSVMRVYYPVYSVRTGDRIVSQFSGLEVPQPYAYCLKAIHRVEDLRRLPLLLPLTVRDSWEKLPRRLQWDSSLRPFDARCMASWQHTLFGNGGFEEWSEEPLAPVGSLLSKGSSVIRRETVQVASGGYAVAQEWCESDYGTPPMESFCWFLDDLQGGFQYTLFLKSKIPDDAEIVLHIVLVYEDASKPGQRAQKLLIEHSLRPSQLFVTSLSDFYVPKLGTRHALLIVPKLKNNPGKVTVFWDDLRLVRGNAADM